MIGRTNAVIGKSQSQWPSADEVQVTYTGDMEAVREITDAAGNKYDLYVLKSTGNLTINKYVLVDICIVGGGENGAAQGYSSDGSSGGYIIRQTCHGGDGAEMENGTIVIDPNDVVECSVGSVGGNTVVSVDGSDFFQKSLVAVAHSHGGSGGGKADYQSISGATGEGDGKSKYVFGDTSVYAYPLCSGGGGGVYTQYNMVVSGGNGGENGGNSTDTHVIRTEGYEVVPTEQAQGGYGAGNGAYINDNLEFVSATDAFTYGSGGGGGYSHTTGDNGVRPIYSNGGSGHGFQGAIFIRILK